MKHPLFSKYDGKYWKYKMNGLVLILKKQTNRGKRENIAA